MTIGRILIITFIALGATPAAADRFLENFVPLDASQRAYSRAAPVAYVKLAKSVRANGNHFLADYLARRAHGMAKGHLHPNVNLSLLNSIPQGSGRDVLEQVADQISALSECSSTVSESALTQFYLRLDVAIFTKATSDELPDDEIFDPYLEELGDLSFLDSSCERLPDVSANSTQVDWNIVPTRVVLGTNGSGIDWNEGTLEGELDGTNTWFAANGRFYRFGASLRPSNSVVEPCQIDGAQISLYYDIDESEYRGKPNNVNLSIAALRGASSAGIVIEGHTDSGGHGTRNIQLAKERAMAVALELERNGIDREKIFLVVLGAHCPQVSMGPNAYVQANRRVVVRFVE